MSWCFVGHTVENSSIIYNIMHCLLITALQTILIWKISTQKHTFIYLPLVDTTGWPKIWSDVSKNLYNIAPFFWDTLYNNNCSTWHCKRRNILRTIGLVFKSDQKSDIYGYSGIVTDKTFDIWSKCCVTMNIDVTFGLLTIKTNKYHCLEDYFD